jgi:hypothetical protein
MGGLTRMESDFANCWLKSAEATFSAPKDVILARKAGRVNDENFPGN